MADVEPGVKARRKPRSERLPETPDAVDIAMHAVASGKALPDVARRLLEEQSRFVRAQTSEIRTRQVGERVRAALQPVRIEAQRVITNLAAAYRADPALLPDGWAGEGEQGRLRGIADYIAGMTDGFAIRAHERLVGPVMLPEKF